MKVVNCGTIDNPWVNTTSGTAVSTIVAAGTYRPQRAPTGTRRVHFSAAGTWNSATVALKIVHPSGYIETVVASIAADGVSGPWVTVGASTVEITVTGTPTGVVLVAGCEVDE